MNHSPAVLDELPSSLAVSETVRDLIDVSVSENTRRAYRYALKKFGDHLAGAPVTDQTISEYLGQLHEAGKSPQTCTQVVAAIKFAAKLHGMTPPLGPVTSRVLTGIRRTGRGRGRGQVQGVTWAQARRYPSPRRAGLWPMCAMRRSSRSPPTLCSGPARWPRFRSPTFPTNPMARAL